MEPGLLPPDAPPPVSTAHREIDGRGRVTVLIAMTVIGLVALRPAPAPSEPARIPCADSEAWMADALPGVGLKTRERQWQRIRSGDRAALPARARAVADQVFIWPEDPVVVAPTGSAHPQHP